MIEFTVVNYISRRTTSKAVVAAAAAANAAASARKRSSSRLLSASSNAPGSRLSEFHNLLFDVTAIGVRNFLNMYHF